MTAFVSSLCTLHVQHKGTILASVYVGPERRAELHAYATDQLLHFQVRGDSQIAWHARQQIADVIVDDVRGMIAGVAV